MKTEKFRTNRKMRIVLLLLCCIVFQCGLCQSEKVLDKYIEVVSSIKNISYEVQRRDSGNYQSKVEGTVWLRRNPKDTLFGFNFVASRNDLHKRYVYRGGPYLQIDLKKRSYLTGGGSAAAIMQTQGGILVAQELLLMPANYDTLTCSESERQFVISMYFKYDSIQRMADERKVIFLNKQTYLPDSIVRIGFKGNGRNKRKLKYTQIIKSIKVDDSMTDNMLSLKYTELYEEELKYFNANLKFLMGKSAPNFKLEDLDGNKVRLEELRGKIVLLDFLGDMV